MPISPHNPERFPGAFLPVLLLSESGAILLRFGPQPEALRRFVLLSLLTAAARQDLLYRRVPNRYPALIAFLALLPPFSPALFPRLAAAVLTLLLLDGLNRLMRSLGLRTLGGADVKILSALALHLSFGRLLRMILLASALAAIRLLTLRRRRGEAFPFVPFIARAAAAELLWG